MKVKLRNRDVDLLVKMPNVLVCIFAMLILSACNSSTKNDIKLNEGVPNFVVQPEFYNFGTLESGEVTYFSFKISNSGEGILNIDSIDAGCGCIQVTWNNNGLATGESDYIQLIFDSSGEWGNIYKPIVIYSNSGEKKKNIYISAKVNNQLFK